MLSKALAARAALGARRDNKVDRQDARAKEVLDLVYSLYIDLGANEHQIDFPVIYAIAREGKAAHTVAGAFEADSLKPLFDAILTHVPPPPAGDGTHVQMLVDNLDYDEYVGRLAIGRITSGVLHEGDAIAVIRDEGKIVPAKVVRLYGYDGLKRVEIKDAGPGEIVCIAGAEEIGIGDTIADPTNPVALPRISVEEPTMSMVFKVNDGPFAGKEGKYVTSRNIRERLYREAYKNVSIRVEDTDDARRVQGRRPRRAPARGDRRDHAPRGLRAHRLEPGAHHQEIDGEVHEPMELLVCDLPEDGVGGVTQRMRTRRGRMADLQPLGSRPRAPAVPRPGARPHRLPRRVPHAHPRRGHHVLAVRRLRAVAGPHREAEERRDRGRSHRRRHRLRLLLRCRSAARCSCGRATRCTQG